MVAFDIILTAKALARSDEVNISVTRVMELSAVYELLLLLLSGKDAETYNMYAKLPRPGPVGSPSNAIKSLKQKNKLSSSPSDESSSSRSESKTGEETKENNFFDGYELAFGAFLTLTSGPFAAQVRAAMCDNPEKYERAWRLLLLCPGSAANSGLKYSLHFIDGGLGGGGQGGKNVNDHIIGRYLSRLYISFLENTNYAVVFLEQVNKWNVTQHFFERLHLPSMARFLDFFLDTPTNGIKLKMDGGMLAAALFDEDKALTTSYFMQGVMSKPMESSTRVNDLLKDQFCENADVAEKLVGSVFRKLGSPPSASRQLCRGLDVLTAIVESHDGGCVSVGEEEWQEHDCALAAMPLFKMIVDKVPFCVQVLLDHILEGDEQGTDGDAFIMRTPKKKTSTTKKTEDDISSIRLPVPVMQIAKFLVSLVRLECAFVDKYLLQHKVLQALVSLFYCHKDSPILLAAISGTFTFLLLHKHPVTNELQSYRRKKGDKLRRDLIDNTIFFSNATTMLESKRTNHTEDSFGFMVLLLNVLKRSNEEIKDEGVKSWIKQHLEKHNKIAFGKPSGPFDVQESEAVVQEVLASPKADGNFDCDGFKIQTDGEITIESPFKITMREDDERRAMEESKRNEQLKRVKKRVVNQEKVSKKVASERHSSRMQRANKRMQGGSLSDDEEEGGIDHREGRLGRMFSSPSGMPSSLPSLSFSSSDEENEIDFGSEELAAHNDRIFRQLSNGSTNSLDNEDDTPGWHAVTPKGKSLSSAAIFDTPSPYGSGADVSSGGRGDHK